MATTTGSLARLGTPDENLTDAERIDAIRRLDDLKAAATAAQARLTDGFVASQRERHLAAGRNPRHQDEGLPQQVGWAHRESPHRGGQLIALARVLVHEMPATLAAMTEGWLSQRRAEALVRETACLSLDDRRTVDRVLAGDRARIESLSYRQLEAEAKRLAATLDAEAVVARARKAEADRRVSIRPAPDTMVWVGALLPVKQGVAAYAALKAYADRGRADGDDRSQHQLMADEFVARLTGVKTAGQIPVTVGLVMTDRALLHRDDEPAEIEGYGPVPAEWARDLLVDTLEAQGVGDDVLAWMRRLYTHPTTGELVSMDSVQRAFTGALARYLGLRDGGICRNAFCGAPIRHVDHVRRVADGGATTGPNGQGLCEACNYAKEAPGWSTRVVIDHLGRHVVETTTPTGHTYRSPAPALPGHSPPPWRGRVVEFEGGIAREVEPGVYELTAA
ncbi:HNH endonuclease [Nocardioides ferulae]|uniref:HNH endonuclease n=1 Tax=Nocardioides ferulae TaxID=2340821 RepID=UPI00197D28BD|nr:DUF222 domain-containing protein [Nocardioides ferulae]